MSWLTDQLLLSSKIDLQFNLPSKYAKSKLQLVFKEKGKAQ